MLEFIPKFTILDFIDILIVAFLIYRVLIYLSRTKALRILLGLLVIILISVVAKILNLYTLSFIFNNFITIGIFALIVIFQPEVRRLLAKIGERQFGIFSSKQEAEKVIEEIVRASARMSEDRIGALIVIEREIKVDNYVDAGTVLDAKVSKELIVSIFWPGTPLHDGAIIVKSDRIYKAGTFLPLTLNPNLPQTIGTRHRAGIGITEETDAVAVIVSEETGAISVSYSGKLIKEINPQKLRKMLTGLLVRKVTKKTLKDIILDIIRGRDLETAI